MTGNPGLTTLHPEESQGFAARSALAVLTVAYCVMRIEWDARIVAAGGLFILLDYLMSSRLLSRSIIAQYVLIALQAGVIGAVFIAPAPIGFGNDIPTAMFLYTPFVFLLWCWQAGHATATRPLTCVWTGALVLGIWWALRHVAMADPLTVTIPKFPLSHYKSLLDVLREVHQPHYFSRNIWFTLELAIVDITALLFLVNFRTHRLAVRTARRVSLLNALAAHFSPQVAELLARSRQAGSSRWSKDVAVLDCDLVGFTTLAEKCTPGRVAEILRAYRSVVEKAVFGAEGAIVTFTGDGVTAVFGLTDTQRSGALAALDCALRIRQSWSEAGRRLLGEECTPAVIGIDFGPVQSGFAGEGRALSFLILGEPVKGAAALQSRTRELGAAILVSDAEKAAAVAADPEIAESLRPIQGADAVVWSLDSL
jgi:class 3 adenylate cyclase